MKKIKEFIDGSYLAYSTGNFDDWCVYIIKSNGEAVIPLDTDYFQQIHELSLKYGVDKVYGDFANIYDSTNKDIDEVVLQKITECSLTYGYPQSINVDKLFTTIYMTMISEENYPNTRLGKRIKRLGIYEMLYNKRTVYDAANFMRGMSWKEIAHLCEERGF